MIGNPITYNPNRLMIALDLSSSMKDFTVPGGQTRLDWILAKLGTALRELRSSVIIRLYVFHDDLCFIGEHQSVQSVLDETAELHRRPTGGSTRLWDSLAKLIGSIPEDEPWTIICGTDAEDCGSKYTRQSVENLLFDKKGSTLTIIDLSGKELRSSYVRPEIGTGGTTILSSSKDSNSIDDALLQVMTGPKGTVTHLDIPVAVIPLCSCTESDVEIVCRAIRQAVPYLEQLTGLRYYPAPTYLIDSQQMQALSPDRPSSTEVAPDTKLASDLQELIQFVKAMALSFHTRRFLPRGILDDIQDYAQFSSLREDSLWTLVRFSEDVGGYLLSCLANDDTGSDCAGFHIPELSKIDDALVDSEANLREIAKILKRLAVTYPSQVSVPDEYFYDFDPSAPSLVSGGPTPDLDAWNRRISDKEMHTVQQTVNQSGSWTLELDDMVAVLEIAINNIFPLISRLLVARSGLSRLRAVGLYVPPDSATNNSMRQIDRGHNVSIAQDKTGGKVFIDIECCADIARGVSSDSGLAGKLLSSVVLHEHAHAVAREGQPFASGLRITQWPSLPSETLAEWAELDFFRNDPMMHRIILRHAGSGRLPEWPYAGALWLERMNVKSPNRAYRKLLTTLRTSPDKAIQKIIAVG